jgi:predicted CoA-binding protein
MATNLGQFTKFFSSKYYGVIGPSPIQSKLTLGLRTNPNDIGYKVLKWYRARKLPVTIIQPKDKGTKVIEGLPFIRMLDLPNPEETSLSFTTTRGRLLHLVREARWMGVKRIWIEPKVWAQKGDNKRSKHVWRQIEAMGFEVVISPGNSILFAGQRVLDGETAIKNGEGLEEIRDAGPEATAQKDGQSTVEPEVEPNAKSNLESYVNSMAESKVESKLDSIAESKP